MNDERPERKRDPAAEAAYRLPTLRARLDALPMAQPLQAGENLYADLHRLAGLEIAADARLRALELMDEPTVELTRLLAERVVRGGGLPLQREAAAARLWARLHAAAGAGYRIALETLPQGAPDRLVMFAAVRGLEHAGCWLLAAYTSYRRPDPEAWRLLHGLYRSIENHPETEHRAAPGLDGTTLTAGAAYRRALLLALADPYHLMLGEAQTVHRWAGRWASRLRIGDEGWAAVDLAADTGPRPAELLGEAAERRVLDPGPAAEAVRERLTELLGEYHPARGRPMPLPVRRERDLLLRLLESWGRRPRRTHRRIAELARVAVAVGLSAAHHELSGGAPFRPSQREMQLGGTTAALRIVEEEPPPEESELLAPGDSGVDVWQRIYRPRPQPPGPGSGRAGAVERHDVLILECADVSTGGLALRCPLDSPVRFQPGEVLAFRTAGTAGTPDWHVGAVRWLLQEEGALRAGVRRFGHSARPVAVRAVAGTGRGGTYQRALVIPDVDLLEEPAALLVPGHIYDAGTVLLVQLDDRIVYLRLTKQLDGTARFARYLYEAAEAPEELPPTPRSPLPAL